MKKIYSFLMLALALALGSASAHAQSIFVTPDVINADAWSNGGELTVNFDGYNVSDYYPSVQFYDADGVTPVKSGVYAWLQPYFSSENQVIDYSTLHYWYDSNPGIARTAYFRVVLEDPNHNYIAVDSSNLITLTQAAATCPAPDHLALTEGSITANGGTFTWDGRDRSGKRVASGVYMVATATSDGKKGTVCKIAIIR